MDSTQESPAICTEWYPIRQFLAYPGYEFALIILNQPISEEGFFRDLWRIAETRVAADGGANWVYQLNQKSLSSEGSSASFSGNYVNLDTIIGDLDSISDETRRFFSTKPANCNIIYELDDYCTDFAKAVKHVRKEFPKRDIVCMGGLGGRVDQGLSQLHHLYLFQTSPTYADGRMYLVSGESLSFLLKAGKHRIHVREPDAIVGNSVRISGEPFAKWVGIIPIKEAGVITTRGLEWDVENWLTEFGGQMSTSNHVLPETKVVEIETTKDVLFTIALKQEKA
ncbi:thiamine pyrophosphokinase [Daldinia caldariorum]|uniref:thiamine pyrophosphokinase n=1 Tax=Daldinia caldariorum TaxID=326644 RepID=UPI00200743D8|nr:thiamine pyrophosphokinase [Daldinia caldariorum]KAI1463769.1 thiamine pyrophosphokinase [Daldinia caldariorum]